MAKHSRLLKDQLSNRTKNDDQTVFEQSRIRLEEKHAATELRTMVNAGFTRMNVINDTASPFDPVHYDVFKK